jgi:hypothetical protein
MKMTVPRPGVGEPGGRRGNIGIATEPSSPRERSEDLGTSSINGIRAQGTRITTTVPVGAIGNDREFQSVTERWFSPELNLLVKSVSTDPRFGTTTFELTNISRTAPDSSYFQIPADYAVTTPAGRGGRGQ